MATPNISLPYSLVSYNSASRVLDLASYTTCLTGLKVQLQVLKLLDISITSVTILFFFVVGRDFELALYSICVSILRCIVFSYSISAF